MSAIYNIVANFVYNDFRVRFVSLVKSLAAFLLAPWRAARVINSSIHTLSTLYAQQVSRLILL